MKFNLRLQDCCGRDELRPVMSHVYFDGNKIVASDAHVLVCVDMRDIPVDEKTIKLLDKKLVHYKGWMKIWNKEVEVKEDGIHCKDEHIIVPFSGIDKKYPEWERVCPSFKNAEKIDSIGINVRLLKSIDKCLPHSEGSFHFYFDTKITAILISRSSGDKSFAFLMPWMLTDVELPQLDKYQMTYFK